MSLITNHKAGFNYEFTEKYVAGIELFGFEVKSLRKKQGSLDGGKVLVRGGEAFLVGIYIPPYQAGNTPASYDPYRTRRLLLSKAQLLSLSTTEQAKTLTIAPHSLYLKNGLIKCEIALCKKKNARDKREDIKKDISRKELQER